VPSPQNDPLFSIADSGVFSCAQCHKPMKLSSIEPGKPGFDMQTFKCEKCNSTLKFAVAV
jgi:hypothetical protein